MAAAGLDASLLILLVLVTISDLRTRLIPDAPLIAGLVIAVAFASLAEPATLPVRLISGAGAAGFLLAAALIRAGGMGLGDAKLAGVLGVYLGSAVVAALTVAFAAGSAAGLVLLARHGWAARGCTVPFAPFLALGALTAAATTS